MNILVAGGAGYIGSHTVIELIAAGHTPIIADNLANSSLEAIHRVETIVDQKIPFVQVDLTDKEAVAALFKDNDFDAVVLFAGYKAVGESVQKPLMYYRNNLDVALTVLEAMQSRGVKKIIFSSSATVYGNPRELPVKETAQTGVGLTNSYGQTKFMIEQILRDMAVADPSWEITILRYFNPIGAHSSGLIGEDPNGPPQNILPYISQVAVGLREKLLVFGDDYDTPDGTGVRDYIHVVDLAQGHIAALTHSKAGVAVYNLGTGAQVSVFDLLHAFEKACGKTLPYEVVARREGDIASAYADPSKAQQELGWHAQMTLEEACADAWRWQSQNPNGYSATSV
ncbi:MAG: UDP-glucose 4-epimerase GalE [Candidatus Saccharibacteria bacterium]